MNQTGGDFHNGSFDFDETYYKRSGVSLRIVKHHCPNCNCLEDGRITALTECTHPLGERDMDKQCNVCGKFVESTEKTEVKE